MPVAKAELEAYLGLQQSRVMTGINVDNSLLKIIPLVTDPLADLLAKNTSDFVGRNFKEQTIPLDVQRNLQREQTVARAYDILMPVVVLMSLGIHDSIARSPKREIDMEFQTVPLVQTDAGMGYIGRARIFIVWGNKIGLTQEDKSHLLAPIKPQRRLPWRRKIPEVPREALAADFNQVTVTIWPEQTRLDFVPSLDTPDFMAVNTEEFLKNLRPLVSAMQDAFNNPQHFRITAYRVA